MAETIKLPGFGPTSKTTVYVLGGGLALLVGIVWYRSKHVASAGDTTQTTQAQNDPATGYPYGSPQDAAALAGQASYVAPVPATGGAPTASAFTTNGQWSQAAEEYLVNNTGADANTVGNALGKYITGQALSADQVQIVESAIAFTGYPPVNGPDGHPPSYRTAVAPPTPPPGAAPENIPNRTFVPYKNVSWDQVARAENVFAGNGRALWAYNTLPGKHRAGDFPTDTDFPRIGAHPLFEVAIPVSGKQLDLSKFGLGVVTS